MKPKCPLCDTPMRRGVKPLGILPLLGFVAAAVMFLPLMLVPDGHVLLFAVWGVIAATAIASYVFSGSPLWQCPNCGRQERILA